MIKIQSHPRGEQRELKQRGSSNASLKEAHPMDSSRQSFASQNGWNDGDVQ